MSAALIFSACGGNNAGNAGGTAAPSSAGTSGGTAAGNAASDNTAAATENREVTYANAWAEKNDIPNAFFNYPLEGNREVSWFFPMDSFISVGIKDFNEHEVFKAVQEKTGIKINFVMPPVGEFDTRFNMMVASNDYTDIITWSNAYRGGVTAGIADGVYYDHTDIVDQFSPNYKYFREGNEWRRKTTVNDAHQVLGYYMLSPYPEWMWLGLLIKQEALDATGLPVPETIGEWEAFLTACRDAGYSGAYTTGNKSMLEWMGSFNAAFDAWEWRYLDDQGKAAFGPIQPQTKEWLAVYRDWFSKGLIDQEFVSRDWSNMMAFAQTSENAVITDSPDTMWGIWKDDMGIDFVGANNAVLNKGDTPRTVYMHPYNGSWETSITTMARDVEACARLLDFGYTWDGYVLYNFGLPGKTHEIGPDGKPFYPENSAMWNPNDDVPLSNRVWKYKVHQGPFIREEHNSNPMIVSPGSYSGKIREQWTEATDNSRYFPPATILPEETSREAELGSAYSARRDEIFTKIVYGELPLDAFDDYVAEVKNNGFDEWIGIWQRALDRFNDR